LVFPGEAKDAMGEKGTFVEKLTLFEIVPSVPLEESSVAEDADGRAAEMGVGPDGFERRLAVLTRVISEVTAVIAGAFPNSTSPNREIISRKMNSCVEVFTTGTPILVFVGLVYISNELYEREGREEDIF
jgi:hypothetical protein